MTLAQRFVSFRLVTVSRQATASRYLSSTCSQYIVNWTLAIGATLLRADFIKHVWVMNPYQSPIIF